MLRGADTLVPLPVLLLLLGLMLLLPLFSLLSMLLLLLGALLLSPLLLFKLDSSFPYDATPQWVPGWHEQVHHHPKHIPRHLRESHAVLHLATVPDWMTSCLCSLLKSKAAFCGKTESRPAAASEVEEDSRGVL